MPGAFVSVAMAISTSTETQTLTHFWGSAVLSCRSTSAWSTWRVGRRGHGEQQIQGAAPDADVRFLERARDRLLVPAPTAAATPWVPSEPDSAMWQCRGQTSRLSSIVDCWIHRVAASRIFVSCTCGRSSESSKRLQERGRAWCPQGAGTRVPTCQGAPPRRAPPTRSCGAMI